jgi:hypothetical protein
MFLELLFAGGIVLLGLFVYATCRTFAVMYRLRAVNEAAIFMFFLTRGLTEAGQFGGMTGYSSIAFSVAIALVVSKCVGARPAMSQRRRVNWTGAASRLQSSRI